MKLTASRTLYEVRVQNAHPAMQRKSFVSLDEVLGLEFAYCRPQPAKRKETAKLECYFYNLAISRCFAQTVLPAQLTGDINC